MFTRRDVVCRYVFALAMGLVWGLVPASAPHHLARSAGFLLDFRPVLANRRAMAYVLAYFAHNWELFALRSWLVAFLVREGVNGYYNLSK